MLGIEVAGGARGLRLGVLDVLAFVEDDGAPRDALEHRGDEAQLGVVDHEEVELFEHLPGRRGLGLAKPVQPERGREFLGLLHPNVHDALRAYDEARPVFGPAFAQPLEPGERLQGFPEPHVIREDAAEMVRREGGQEMEPFELVGPQLGRDARRGRGRDAGLDLAGPLADFLPRLFGKFLLTRGIRKLEDMEPLRFAREIERIEPETGEAAGLFLIEVEIEPAPPFAVQPHEAAARFQEKVELLGGEIEVGRLQPHAEIEPVDAARLDLELDRRLHRGLEKRVQFALGEDFHPRRKRPCPLDEFLGKGAVDPTHPALLRGVGREPQRGQEPRHLREAAAFNEEKFAVLAEVLLKFHPAPGLVLFRELGVRGRGAHPHLEVLALHKGVGFQLAEEGHLHREPADAFFHRLGQGRARTLERFDALLRLERLRGDAVAEALFTRDERRRAAVNGVPGDVVIGVSRQDEDVPLQGPAVFGDELDLVTRRRVAPLRTPGERMFSPLKRVPGSVREEGAHRLVAEERVQETALPFILQGLVVPRGGHLLEENPDVIRRAGQAQDAVPRALLEAAPVGLTHGLEALRGGRPPFQAGRFEGDEQPELDLRVGGGGPVRAGGFEAFFPELDLDLAAPFRQGRPQPFGGDEGIDEIHLRQLLLHELHGDVTGKIPETVDAGRDGRGRDVEVEGRRGDPEREVEGLLLPAASVRFKSDVQLIHHAAVPRLDRAADAFVNLLLRALGPRLARLAWQVARFAGGGSVLAVYPMLDAMQRERIGVLARMSHGARADARPAFLRVRDRHQERPPSPPLHHARDAVPGAVRAHDAILQGRPVPVGNDRVVKLRQKISDIGRGKIHVKGANLRRVTGSMQLRGSQFARAAVLGTGAPRRGQAGPGD